MMKEIDRLEKVNKSLRSNIIATEELIVIHNEKIAELKKAEEPKKIGISMTEQQGMIVVSVSEDGKQRSQYIYEDWTQVFRQLPNEEEFKR